MERIAIHTVRMSFQITEALAGEVRAAVAKKRLKHSDLAVALRLSKAQVSRRMRGETSFSAEEFLLLARHLGISVAELYGEVAA